MRNQAPTPPRRDSVEYALDILGDRWTFLILREAFFGVRRYGAFQRNLGIARNVLANRLRRLVDHRMLTRVRYRTDPDWYEYRLTEQAIDLYPVIVALMRWADRHLETGTPVELTHRTCGHPAHPYLACGHCHKALTAHDIQASSAPRASGSS